MDSSIKPNVPVSKLYVVRDLRDGNVAYLGKISAKYPEATIRSLINNGKLSREFGQWYVDTSCRLDELEINVIVEFYRDLEIERSLYEKFYTEMNPKFSKYKPKGTHNIGDTFSSKRLHSYEGRNVHGHSMWKYQCLKCDGVQGPTTVSHLRRTEACQTCVIAANGNSNWQGYEGLGKVKYSQALNGAQRRKLEFCITIEDMWVVWNDQEGRCALSGVKLNLKTEASLDRIDSSLGYHLANIQWVHKDINQMKMDSPETEFVTWCRKVAEFHSWEEH